MSNKKDTARRPPPATTPPHNKSRAELRKQLASNIAAIFTNPETPACLHNTLKDGMIDLFNHVPDEPRQASEAYILALLEVLASVEAKGGAR